MTKLVIYSCKNKACPLGGKEEGRFTGGASQELAISISGDPEAIYGEGVCPNCGKEGTKTKDEHVIVKKDGDPHQDLHDEIHARVLDENDPLTQDQAQAELTKLVEAQEGDNA